MYNLLKKLFMLFNTLVVCSCTAYAGVGETETYQHVQSNEESTIWNDYGRITIRQYTIKYFNNATKKRFKRLTEEESNLMGALKLPQYKLVDGIFAVFKKIFSRTVDQDINREVIGLPVRLFRHNIMSLLFPRPEKTKVPV